MAKAKKPRTKHYQKPFAVKGSFEDVIKVAMKKKPNTDEKKESE